MVPFMSGDLTNMLRSLLEKFIKPSVMKNETTPLTWMQQLHYNNYINNYIKNAGNNYINKNATTTLKLLQVDYADPINHMDVTKLRVGFVTERALEGPFRNFNPQKVEVWMHSTMNIYPTMQSFTIYGR